MFPRTGFTLEHCRILSTFRLTFWNFYTNLFKPLIYHIRSYVGMSFFGQLFQKDAPVLSRMIVSRLVSRSKIVESFQTFNSSFKFQSERLQEDVPVHEWSFRNQKLSNPSKLSFQRSEQDAPRMILSRLVSRSKIAESFQTFNPLSESQSPTTLQPRMIVSRLVSYPLKNCRILPNF